MSLILAGSISLDSTFKRVLVPEPCALLEKGAAVLVGY
jgi:hypothetical protein